MVVCGQIKGNDLINKIIQRKHTKTITTILNHPQENKKRIRKRKETSG